MSYNKSGSIYVYKYITWRYKKILAMNFLITPMQYHFVLMGNPKYWVGLGATYFLYKEQNTCTNTHTHTHTHTSPWCNPHSHTPSGRELLLAGDTASHRLRNPSFARTSPVGDKPTISWWRRTALCDYTNSQRGENIDLANLFIVKRSPPATAVPLFGHSGSRCPSPSSRC